MSDCSHESCCTEAARLRAENERLLSANDTLVTRIEDLTQGYALEDTCPRVQCQTTSKRLKAQANEIHEAYLSLADERDAMREALLVAQEERDLWCERMKDAEAALQQITKGGGEMNPTGANSPSLPKNGTAQQEAGDS